MTEILGRNSGPIPSCWPSLGLGNTAGAEILEGDVWGALKCSVCSVYCCVVCSVYVCSVCSVCSACMRVCVYVCMCMWRVWLLARARAGGVQEKQEPNT